MEKKKTYREYNIPNDTLRERFLMKYSSKRNGKDYTLFQSSPWGINKGIEMNSTNGIGYEKIRKEGERIRTMKGLRQHLAEMDFRVLENELNNLENGLFPAIPPINYLETHLRKKNNLIETYEGAVNLLLEQIVFYKERDIENTNHLDEIYELFDLKKENLNKTSSTKEIQLEIPFPKKSFFEKFVELFKN